MWTIVKKRVEDRDQSPENHPEHPKGKGKYISRRHQWSADKVIDAKNRFHQFI